MDWRVLLVQAGNIIKSVAGSFGPMPALVADFAVDVTELACDCAIDKSDPVKLAQDIADRSVDLIQKLKQGT